MFLVWVVNFCFWEVVVSILLISPYHGGSHQAWAEGYQRVSQQAVELLTLPARFWKWRMEGGAVTLARRFLAREKRPNLILATDMFDLTTFLSLTRHLTHNVPVVLYMHENQLTYPLPEGEQIGPMRRQLGERDMHYAFINYSSMLTADLVLFNSHYHLESWFAALPNLLKHFPEYQELESVELLKTKSQVLPVGVDFGRLMLSPSSVEKGMPPLILWNQRWEYDKNPEAFFQVLEAVADLPFRLALCGQWFGKRPIYLEQALQTWSDRIVHFGFASEELYKRLLWQADVVISTAHHEFFGISILEAVYCHTFPILPHRLSYPEILPDPFHLVCLYQNEGGLVQRLRWALTHVAEVREKAQELGTAVARYDWQQMAPEYDRVLSRFV